MLIYSSAEYATLSFPYLLWVNYFTSPAEFTAASDLTNITEVIFEIRFQQENHGRFSSRKNGTLRHPPNLIKSPSEMKTLEL